jgi:hypothetical protein
VPLLTSLDSTTHDLDFVSAFATSLGVVVFARILDLVAIYVGYVFMNVDILALLQSASRCDFYQRGFRNAKLELG